MEVRRDAGKSQTFPEPRNSMSSVRIQIFHNPRCSKSREALAFLAAAHPDLDVIDYLKTPPDLRTLQALQAKLGLPAREMLRSNEDEFSALGLDAPGLSDAALLSALAAHPKLLQRPLVVQGERALIARPPELLKDWLA